MQFKDLIFLPRTDFFGGHRAVAKFDNGWEVSVIYGGMSYARRNGMYEVAILDPTGDLNYNTPITDDVVVVNEEQLEAILAEVETYSPEAYQ